MNVHLFTCAEGWHLTLWRLNIWHLHGHRYWKPWRSPDGHDLYWLRFCFEWN